MNPQSLKHKGRLLQQTVRDAILEKFPQLKPDDVRSTPMASPGEDVQMSPAARELFPLQIECKSVKQVTVYQWYKQAKCHGEHIPAVVFKQNGDQPLICMRLDDFMLHFDYIK